MYTDEFLDQWAKDMDREQERLEAEETEKEAAAIQRDEEVLRNQANCPHENTIEEAAGFTARNGAVEIYTVCEDCGATRPTGRYDYIL